MPEDLFWALGIEYSRVEVTDVHVDWFLGDCEV